jgi:hypothetical protein
MMKWKEESEQAMIQDVMLDCYFKPFQLTVKVTQRMFGDEQKLNFACIKATPKE